MAGLENVIGGPRGLAYTLGPSGLLSDGEVIELRADDPTTELDRATSHRLDGTGNPRTPHEPTRNRQQPQRPVLP